MSRTASARGARSAARRACVHCGLPAARDFCCSGCFLAHRLADPLDPAGGQPSDPLLARVVLSAFLATGVMGFSLALYAPGLHGGAGEAWDGAGARAVEGLARLAACALSAPILWLIGAPLLAAVVSLRRWLSSDALVLAGTSAAWAVSAWNTFRGGGHVYYETATMVLVLVGLGRWLDVRARERARRAALARIPERLRPAARVTPRGEEEVPPGALAVGDRVRVRPGESVPVDGAVVAGCSFVDASDLTGEAEPRAVAAGDLVLAGSRLLDGCLVVEARAVGAGRVRDEVERLLAEALASRPAAVRAADRLAAWLLPIALAVAAGSAALRWDSVGAEKALLDALCVVLIACPCALGIATPLAFWVALGAAWRRGVLVRGGEVLERLARVRRVFLDKTGTLTAGELELARVEPRAPLARDDVLRVAAALELGSEHPIGRAVRDAWRAQHGTPPPAAEGFRVLVGHGVEGRVEGELWSLVRAEERADAAEDGATRVVLLRAGRPAGELAFAARLRPEARAVVAALARRGLEPVVLTGDGRGPARALGAALGIPVEAELLPADKVARVRAARGRTLFVGDGLNDAAALAAAGVGVSVAGGSTRSLEAADVNLLRPGLAELPGLIDLAHRAVRTARANLVWAVAYNAAGLVLAASGRLTPILAAAAMVLSSAAVVLGASRLAARTGARARTAAPGPSAAPAGAAAPAT